jgi:hypothetical protein
LSVAKDDKAAFGWSDLKKTKGSRIACFFKAPRSRAPAVDGLAQAEEGWVWNLAN